MTDEKPKYYKVICELKPRGLVWLIYLFPDDYHTIRIDPYEVLEYIKELEAIGYKPFPI